MTEIVLTEAAPIVFAETNGEFVIETTGIIGSGLPPTTGNDGFALIEVDSVAAFRPILESYLVPGFDIASLTVNPSVAEVGQSVATPSFVASYNRAPDTAELTDNDGNPPKNVIATPTAFASDHTFVKNGNNQSVTFGLAATEGAEGDSRNVSIAWRPRTFWGVGPDGYSTEADIESLANSALDNNRQRTFTVTAGAGEHIYYAYPAAYGAATFFVEGFEGGFDLVSDSISVTNPFGVAQNYRLYKSTNPNLGTTTVEVR